MAQERALTDPPSLLSLPKQMSQPLGMEGATSSVGGPLRTEHSLPESRAGMDDALLGSAADPGAGLPAPLTGGSSAEVWDRLQALRTFYAAASSEGTLCLKPSALHPIWTLMIGHVFI